MQNKPYLMRVHPPEWLDFPGNLLDNPELMQHMERVHEVAKGTEYFACFNIQNHCLYLEDGEGREVLILPTDPRKPETFLQAVDILVHALGLLLNANLCARES